MDGSILQDVRVACNLEENDDAFDGQLIQLTNTMLFRSAQIGVGKKGFAIDGIGQRWTDFVSESFSEFESLKTYIGLRVRLIFDPPENGAVREVFEKTADELEWCIYSEADVKD